SNTASYTVCICISEDTPPHLWRTMEGTRMRQETLFMDFPTHEQKQALLEPVLRLADQRLHGDSAAEARAFITHYYHNVDTADLAMREPEDLFGAAMAHLGLARRFNSGTPKLRVYNPRPEEH